MNKSQPVNLSRRSTFFALFILIGLDLIIAIYSLVLSSALFAIKCEISFDVKRWCCLCLHSICASILLHSIGAHFILCTQAYWSSATNDASGKNAILLNKRRLIANLISIAIANECARIKTHRMHSTKLWMVKCTRHTQNVTHCFNVRARSHILPTLCYSNRSYLPIDV